MTRFEFQHCLRRVALAGLLCGLAAPACDSGALIGPADGGGVDRGADSISPAVDTVKVDDRGQPPDSGHLLDSAAPPADATPLVDGGARPADSTTPPVDSTTPPVDSTTPPVDSTTPPVDSTTPAPTTYFVDESHPAASDSNPGSESSPWATINKAASSLKAGERVWIKAGTYAPFEPGASGAAAKPIIYAAYPGHEHAVIVDGAGTSNRGVIEIRAKDYITIEGLRIINADTDGIYIEGTAGEQHGHHVIRDCQIDTTGNAGIYVCGLVMGQTIPVDTYRTVDVLIEGCDVTNTNTPDGKNECISVGGGVDGVVVRNNVIHDSRQYGVDFKLGVRNGEIYGNHIRDVLKHGVYLDAACRTVEHVVVRDNLIHDCGANGITIAREASRGPTQGYEQNIRDVDVFNNVVYRNKRGVLIYKHVADTLVNDFDDVRVFNNTFYDNTDENCRFVDLDSIVTNFVFANNIAFQSGAKNIVNEYTSDGLATNNVTVDPLFVSTGATVDLHLKAGSPAIGAGAAAHAPVEDHDGVTRGSPPAAGAYEYVP